MKPEDHKRKSEEIKKSLDQLLPDELGEHVVAVVELCYGISQHIIAYGMAKRYGEHKDSHVGLPKALRRHGAHEIAEYFEKLDTYRQGRWYGGKGDGEIVRACLDILNAITKWAEYD